MEKETKKTLTRLAVIGGVFYVVFELVRANISYLYTTFVNTVSRVRLMELRYLGDLRTTITIVMLACEVLSIAMAFRSIFLFIKMLFSLLFKEDEEETAERKRLLYRGITRVLFFLALSFVFLLIIVVLGTFLWD